jgi:hypothetical protein
MKQFNENWDGISRKNIINEEVSARKTYTKSSPPKGMTNVEFIFAGTPVASRFYMTADRIHMKFVKLWLQSGVLPDENSHIYTGSPRTVKINGIEKTF